MVEVLHLSPIMTKGQNTSDYAFDALCESIVEGELKPGQRLREVEIAQAFGISRTPIREALRKLEEHHLIKHQLNGAYFVAEWDKKTLWEQATLRGTLESLAVSLAINNIDEEDYLYLEDLIRTMEMMVKRKDYDKLILLDIQFHQYIWSHSNHALLQETLSNMTPQIRYLMMITKSGDEESYAETHHELMAVLKQKDAAKAMEAVQKHILDTAKHLIARLNID